MQEDDVPAEFPQEFLGAVPGAQAKLLVELDSDGRYKPAATVRRRERWLICADLREQLIDYVNNKLPAHMPKAEFAKKVALAIEYKRTAWGISLAEAAWTANEVRAHFDAG